LRRSTSSINVHHQQQQQQQQQVLPPPLSLNDFLLLPAVTITPQLQAAGVVGVDEEGRFLLSEAMHLDLQLDRLLLLPRRRREEERGGGAPGRISPKPATVKGASHAPPPLPSSPPPVSRLRALSGALRSLATPPPAGNALQQPRAAAAAAARQ
jgi:hypothetical protein